MPASPRLKAAGWTNQELARYRRLRAEHASLLFSKTQALRREVFLLRRELAGASVKTETWATVQELIK